MPVSLENLDLNRAKFTGGIPAEWSSMTNLKELKMAHCGLDGEFLVYAQFDKKGQSHMRIMRRAAAR